MNDFKCPHGLEVHICSVCAVAHSTKPKISIHKQSSGKLKDDLVRVNSSRVKKETVEEDFVVPTMHLPNQPKPLSRNFELGITRESTSPFLKRREMFNQKAQEIEELVSKKDLHNIAGQFREN